MSTATATHLQVLEAEAIHIIAFILIDEATNDTVGAGIIADG